MRKIAIALVSVFAFAAPASATVNIFFTQGGTSAGISGLTLLTDFTTGAGVSGNFQIHGPTSDSSGAVPAYGSTGNFLSVLGGKSASIALPGNVTAFAFDWGSLDNYNSLTINGVGGSYGLGGSTLLIPGTLPNNTLANGDQLSSNTNGVLYVYGDAGETFTSLGLSSRSNSFEIDNLRIAAVPEPATWALMIGGFALAGAALRRRKATVSFA